MNAFRGSMCNLGKGARKLNCVMNVSNMSFKINSRPIYWKSFLCQPPNFVSNVRFIHTNMVIYKKMSHINDTDELVEMDELLTFDKQYANLLEESYLLPISGHNVFIIQPENKQQKLSSTTPILQLEEACSLVEALPNWTIVEKGIYATKSLATKTLYGKGKFIEITQKVKETAGVTAVFVNVEMLSPVQLETLQTSFNVPVYDRYTIVLQIFQLRAQSKEAKLQVALAEIPILRSRLRGMHSGTLDQQKGGLSSIGGSGETFLEVRQRLLMEKEQKIQKALSGIRNQRDLTRKERTKNQIPTVAVVGYTNAGKTSLIKALTSDKDLVPKDQLFATLDVTSYIGELPNRMKVLYLDTVGFISNIPTNLIEAFKVTLKDVISADVIVHVQDISHPDYNHQKETVYNTLMSIEGFEQVSNKIINVSNKIDKLEKLPTNVEDSIFISTLEGRGLGELCTIIQEFVIDLTDRIQKRIRIPMNGPHLSWLYKEAVVEATEVCENNPEYLLVDVVFTNASHSKFKASFKSGGTKRRK